MDLLDELDRYFGWPRVVRDERWPLCPLHDDARPGSFSYSERGFCCFACGQSGSLWQLAELVGLRGPLPPGASVASPRPRPRRRQADGSAFWRHERDFWRRFQPLSPAALEYAHSRGLTDSTLDEYCFGSGALPLSRCGQERLILPVIQDGRLVNLRGRVVPGGRQLRPCLEGCDHPKWLQAAGGDTVLFGAETLFPGAEVFVAEAPLSCVLLRQQRPELAAVAGTAGAASWKEEWTAAIAESRPADVVVWLDNDAAGRNAAVKIGNALARARVPVHVHHWVWSDKPKEDLADVVLRTIRGVSPVASQMASA
jgi:DNA primase